MLKKGLKRIFTGRQVTIATTFRQDKQEIKRFIDLL
jgi:hypothetical protein